jgi:hypothetical protein
MDAELAPGPRTIMQRQRADAKAKQELDKVGI